MPAPVEAESPTLGEVFRGLGRVERALEDGFAKVNERFDALDQKYVSKELYESERDATRADVSSLAEAQSARQADWRWRATTIVAVADALGTLAYAFTHLH